MRHCEVIMINTEDIGNVLSETELFAALPEAYKQKMLGAKDTGIIYYSAGETVYSTEKFSRALGIVLDGSVCIYRSGEGKEVLLNKLSRGGVFGAASLFGADENYVTVIIAKTSSSVLFFSYEVCLAAVCECPEFSLAYIRFLSGRIRFLNKRIASFASSGAEEKVVKYLLENNGTVSISMKQFASVLNIGRASLYRVLDELEEKGLITKNGKTVTVTDTENLKQLY